MRALSESLFLFAPWRNRNYLFAYLYSNLALSISVTCRYRGTGGLPGRPPPAPVLCGLAAPDTKEQGGTSWSWSPSSPIARVLSLVRSCCHCHSCLDLRHPLGLSPSWLPGSFHPGREVTFSSPPGLPAREGQSDLVTVALRLERLGPEPLLSSLSRLYDLHLFLGALLNIPCMCTVTPQASGAGCNGWETNQDNCCL